jgi:hypothetical protein
VMPSNQYTEATTVYESMVDLSIDQLESRELGAEKRAESAARKAESREQGPGTRSAIGG